MLNKKQIDKIKEERKKGRKIRELSKSLNVAPSTIFYHLNKKKRNKQRLKCFMKKSKKERSEIYKKRREYMRKYQKERYEKDLTYREYKKNKSKEYYTKVILKEKEAKQKTLEE